MKMHLHNIFFPFDHMNNRNYFGFQSTTNIQSNQKVPSKHPNQSSSNNAERTNDTDSASVGDQNSIDSNSLDDNSVTFRGGSMSSIGGGGGGGGLHDPINSTNAQQIHATNNDDEEPITAQPIIPIHSKTKNWYSIYCNRWVSLFGAILKIVIMMFVNLYYGITCVGLVFLTWFYVYVYISLVTRFKFLLSNISCVLKGYG